MRVIAPLLVLTLASGASASSFRIAGDNEARPADAPYALTASDGSGLRLVSLEADAVLVGPLAFTELRFTFENPNPRVIEGRFRVTLPENAAVSRFAMKIDGGWQEGEVIEKQRARRVYEDFLHRRQDPALLEQAAGNEFRARVFPIPARGTKELILSYSHEIASPNAPYRLPLRGLAEVGRLQARAHGDARGELKRVRFVPDRDFVVERSGATQGIAHSAGFLTPVVPVEEGARDPVGALMILFDTSASQALGFDRRVAGLQRLVEGLAAGSGAKTPVLVAAFDQRVELIYRGPASGFAAGARKLRRRRALGASDLGRALVWAAENARGMDRLVLFTDGVPTAGKKESSELVPALRRLEVTGLQRFDAVVTGGVRDTALLRRVLDVALPRAGAVIDGDQPLARVADALERRTAREVRVEVPGAAWVWPSALQGVQAGEVRWVFASSGTRALKVGGEVVRVDYREVSGPLVERQLRAAQIQSLVAARELAPDEERKAALKAEIVKLSEAHRVLSPFTALLVLETEADYARYEIDRKALADILVVEGGKVVARDRADIVVPARPQLAKPTADKAKEGRKRARAREGEQEPGESADPATSFEGELEEDDGDEAEKSEPRDLEVEGKVAEARPPPPPSAPAPEPARTVALPEREDPADDDDREPGGDGRGGSAGEMAPADPWDGKFKQVWRLIAKNRKGEALALARAWREEDPKAVLALVALGDALAALGDRAGAARAYASIIDLFSSRADLRRYAGNLLAALDGDEARRLAIDTFAAARAQRPDHPASHRLLAMALLKDQRPAEAFAVLEEALQRGYPGGRFEGARQILAEDLGLAAAAWSRVAARERARIEKRLRAAGGVVEATPSLRFVLTWETDANDVDFHIFDARGGHAFYGSRRLPSGGELYADVTTGYGPECFTIRSPKSKRAAPYRLRAHYYSRGPMGYGMGALQVVEHDGRGGLRFEENPFVVMKDGAYVELGVVE